MSVFHGLSPMATRCHLFEAEENRSAGVFRSSGSLRWRFEPTRNPTDSSGTHFIAFRFAMGVIFWRQLLRFMQSEAHTRRVLTDQTRELQFIHIGCSMFLKRLASLACVGLMLVAVGYIMADNAKEVAFPELPKGAGKIDEKAPKEFTTTASGLKYRILREGAGAKPKATQKVEVNYHGWLDNAKVFDSSYKRGESISFGLNQVIAGWTEGMQLVGKGGMIELEIPAKLGYGARGAGQDVPPNATLHFLVELIDLK